MTSSAHAPRRRPGGRSERIKRAVFDATIAILIEDGYDALSLENVAARAGVNKTSVYRRWGRKPNLVAQACLDAAFREMPVPDTGNVRTDLKVLLEEVAHFLMSDSGGAMARAVIGAAGHSPELRETQQLYWDERVRRVGQVIERAVDRGELPAQGDTWGFIETVTGPLWMRYLVSGRPIDGAFIDRVLDIVLAGVDVEAQRASAGSVGRPRRARRAGGRSAR